MSEAYQVFQERIDHVDYLIGYEGNAFAFTVNVEEALLSIARRTLHEGGGRERVSDASWSRLVRRSQAGRLRSACQSGS